MLDKIKKTARAVAIGSATLGFFPLAILAYLISIIPSPETKRIAILGHKGSGKTTLWKKLKGELSHSSETSVTHDAEKIDQFTIQCNDGRTLTIAATKDIGGSKENFKQYFEEVVPPSTFVYYLIDATVLLKEDSKDLGLIVGYLGKIMTHFERQENEAKAKGEEMKGSGLKILLTCYNDFARQAPHLREHAKIIDFAIKKLNLENTQLYSVYKKNFRSIFKVVELRNHADIEAIKNEIPQ